MNDKIAGITTEEHFASGHRACAGCGAALMARLALKAAGKNTIVVNATGCLEVFSTPYPETAWKIPWIHGAFENAAAIASGVNRALKSLGKRKDVNVLVFGGDGGTFDIGFQALSGAAERGENFCYICYDNGAYMNTGIQRSGATPKYASTTTSPVGSKIHGKTEFKKPMPFIMAAHGAYVATANIAFPLDFIEKVKKGLEFNGPAYIQVFSTCPTGWKLGGGFTIQVARLAFESNVTPLYEIEKGVVKISKKPGKVIPVDEYLKSQGRFKHLSESEIKEIQENVDENWQKLLDFEKNKSKMC
ncbi:MAG: pyruvate synthase subunit PorB [Candidatus Nanoarchaeia archaeon]|nr:pyruvate synthase subunit PorB [Candidatus Nanoarchaeia archaeon]